MLTEIHENFCEELFNEEPQASDKFTINNSVIRWELKVTFHCYTSGNCQT